MKKEISFVDYYKYLNDEAKQAIDAELSTSEVNPEDMVIKRISGDVIKETNDETYESTGYASTRVLDFSADVVVPEGINTSIFKKNPVIFYQHLTSHPPIGKATSIRKDDYGLKITIKYAVEENEEASTIYKLVKGEYIRQHSMGFIPLEALRKGQSGFAELNKELKRKYPEYKGDAERIITKSLLLEVSVVNIADNQSAEIMNVKSLNAQDLQVMKKYGVHIEEIVDEKHEVIEPEVKEITEITDDSLEWHIVEPVTIIDKTITLIEEPKPMITVLEMPKPIVKVDKYTDKQIKLIKESTKKGKIVRL